MLNARCLAGLSCIETLWVVVIVVVGRYSGYRKEKEMVHILKAHGLRIHSMWVVLSGP